MWLINNRNVFLTVLEAGKSKAREPAWLRSGGSPFPGFTLPIVTSHGARAEGALWGLLHEGTNPIHGGCTLIA